ncbi:MAG TPA: LCP family protein [Bacillales bacterium]|nr:LCP family protein [Bacillales bacterium]
MSSQAPHHSSPSREGRRKSKKRVWKKVLLIIGCVLGVLIIGGGAYAYHLYHSVQEAANKMYQPPSHGKGNQGDPSTAKHNPVDDGDGTPKPISILLMGVDQRPHDVGRSDTLIVMTLNPKTNKMQMVSIPRDTRVHIPGREGYHKINAAYAYGGTALAMKTVKNYLNVPLDYYIRINMQGLSQLVDAVGGIRVYNDISWHDEGYYKKGYFYHKGWLHLNGPQTLGYVRMRHLDPRGDFGRNERQRDVIQAIVDKAAGFSSFSHYQKILDAISSNVRTNLTFEDMKYIALNYRKCKKHIKTYELHGTPQMINGISWVIVSDSEREKGHQMIMKQLNTQKKAQ